MRRARYGEPPVLPGESAAGGRDGEWVEARSGVGRGFGRRGEEQRARAGGAAGARARRRSHAEPVLAGDAAGACVDVVLPGPASCRRAGTAAAPSALVAGVRPPPPLRSPRRQRRRGRMGRLWLLEKGENGSSPFLLLAPQTTKWVLGLSARRWRQSKSSVKAHIKKTRKFLILNILYEILSPYNLYFVGKNITI